ncbi:MAG: arylsulfatase [Verrucomicrobia bacterium]|nr:MAG: arylsulfatase [Verrucomicrobiota bacterium]
MNPARSWRVASADSGRHVFRAVSAVKPATLPTASAPSTPISRRVSISRLHGRGATIPAGILRPARRRGDGIRRAKPASAAGGGAGGRRAASFRRAALDFFRAAFILPAMKPMGWTCWLAAGALAASVLSPAAVPSRPNVVLIMADDFGYECVGANGCADYQTPHLDRLAAGGMRFEHCHVQPLCTPTRVQLMTGLYNVRNYTRFGELRPEERTFAHVFKAAGYVSGIAGKWQLGHDPGLPRHFGFDESCLWQHTRRPPRYANPGLEYNGVPKDFTHGEYGPELVNDWARDFIRRHRHEPFLLYYPMILTHAPYQPTPDSPDWDPTARGEKVHQHPRHFGEMVAYADKMIGRLVATLEELGLRERTLVIFLGDNGTGRGVRTRMRDGRVIVGGKGSPTPAGTHVPLIANWPGVIPAGRVCGDLVDSTDFFPTICEAAGLRPPENPALDGRSFWPQLQGRPGNPREWTYCWFARDGGAKAQHEFAATKRYKLYRDGRFYDDWADPEEKRPLDPDSDPALARVRDRLQAVLDAFQDARPTEVAARGGRNRN